MTPIGYSSLARPLLFRLPPEAAQRLADFALKRRLLWRALSPAFRVRNDGLRSDLCGLTLHNPIGIAAGYDKDCEFLPSLAALGFGYVVGGTVTVDARPGNPGPRVVRNVKERSLVNSLGFPSKGLEFAARRLERCRESLGETPAVVSVSGVTIDEIVRCHRRLEPLADAVELNISSPNTAGLKVFHEPGTLAELMGRINDGRKKPLFVKLPPLATGIAADTDRRSPAAAKDDGLLLVRTCVEQGVDGLTVANSRPIAEPRLAVGAGGLSGKPIFAEMLRMVAEVKAEAGDRAVINACGGIFTGEDAWAALKAGASSVQLLTGLIYRGPGVAKLINKELVRIMARERGGSVDRRPSGT